MRLETRDPIPKTERSGVKIVGAWLLVAWMVAVCSSYAYFMLRSLF